MPYQFVQERDIQLIICDMDRTLSRYQPDANAKAGHFAALGLDALLKQHNKVHGLTIAELQESIVDVFAKKGGRWLDHFEKKYGVPHEAIHHAYHDALNEADILDPCHETAAGMRGLADSEIILACLTHGSRRWAMDKQLPYLGMEKHFHPELVFGLEDVGFNYKHESEEPFLHVLEKVREVYGISIEPHQAVMIEDSHANLMIPDQMGMGTVLVHHGAGSRNLGAHVHVQVPNIGTFEAAIAYEARLRHALTLVL